MFFQKLSMPLPRMTRFCVGSSQARPHRPHLISGYVPNADMVDVTVSAFHYEDVLAAEEAEQ